MLQSSLASNFLYKSLANIEIGGVWEVRRGVFVAPVFRSAADFHIGSEDRFLYWGGLFHMN